jgi:1-acyl-sn-glycerol-3-phosphate acyltransferase
MRPAYRLTAFIVRSLARLVFGLKITGREHVPLTGRLLIAANHVSKADPPLVGCCIPREVYYAAQIELFRGFLGVLVRFYNSIPVRRSGVDKEAVQQLIRLLTEEKAVVIFPEGGRSRHGIVKPPKPGVGLLAIQTGASIVPVHIQGSHHWEGGFKSWIKLIFRRDKLSVDIGRPVPLHMMIPPDMEDREAYGWIAEQITERIRQGQHQQ